MSDADTSNFQNKSVENFFSTDHKTKVSYKCRKTIQFCKITRLIYFKFIILCLLFVKIFDLTTFLLLY